MRISEINDRGPALVVLAYVFFLLSTSATLARLGEVAAKRRAFGWSDGLITVASVSCCLRGSTSRQTHLMPDAGVLTASDHLYKSGGRCWFRKAYFDRIDPECD